MIKRILGIILAGMVFCVSLTACGSKDTSSDNGAGASVEGESVVSENEISDTADVEESDASTVAASGTYEEPSKEDFVLSELDDGTLLIKEYKGEAPYIIIPEDIGGKTVTMVTGLNGDSLKGVEIPDSVTTICDSAFNNSENLEEVKLGNSVEVIEECAFINCYNLKSINLQDSITTIGEDAFNGNSLEEIHISTGITEIPAGAFCNGCWKELTIPGNVKVVGDEAFAGNDELVKVTIEDGVEEIKHAAFRHCDKLEELHIPASVALDDGMIVDSTDILTIYAPAGSAAETYANENGINFVAE